VVNTSKWTYVIFPLAGLACLPVWEPMVHAQPANLQAPADTSYFQAGDDNWNLVESVIRGEPANTLFLLKRGADPNAMAEGGMTALMYAAEVGDTMQVKILVLNGADLELTHVENTTPLMVAILNRQFDTAHLLLKKGADPDHQDEYKGTSLIYAAAMNEFRMADLLLFFGATDSLKDGDGNDAMMTAVCMGHLETTDVLLQNGIPPDSRDKKLNTPLMVAAQQGNVEMVSLLLEYGAGTGQVNQQKYTPLAHAIHTGHPETARILVDSGSNVNHTISRNQNLYDLALQKRQKEIQKILKSKGAGPTPRPDFSEIGVGWGNSFGNGEHMMQVRVWWQDRKFGFFAETGYDIRPTLRTIQVGVNDTLIHQYRESRSAWIHGAGKYFTLAKDAKGIEYGFYGGLYGMLSFATYRGISEAPPVKYSLVPSAGLFMQGKMAGLKAGTERYTFGTLQEGRWKVNITLYARIPYKQRPYEIKEVGYE
jgi:ankyrin repeat protein